MELYFFSYRVKRAKSMLQTGLLFKFAGAVHFATRTGYDGRIVGGSPANITNYPYQVL